MLLFCYKFYVLGRFKAVPCLSHIGDINNKKSIAGCIQPCLDCPAIKFRVRSGSNQGVRFSIITLFTKVNYHIQTFNMRYDSGPISTYHHSPKLQEYSRQLSRYDLQDRSKY